MIKCDENTIEIEGNGMELMAEFASIAKHLVKGGCPKKNFWTPHTKLLLKQKMN